MLLEALKARADKKVAEDAIKAMQAAVRAEQIAAAKAVRAAKFKEFGIPSDSRSLDIKIKKSTKNFARKHDSFRTFEYGDVKNLFAKKFKYLGAGAYGTVYAPHDTSKNYVFKVGNTDRNGAYLSYVKVAMANQANPYFPRIQSIKYYRSSYGNTFVVKMERLAQFDETKDQSAVQSFLHGNSLKQTLKFMKGIGVTVETPAYAFLKQVDDALSPLFAMHCNDCHKGNFMFRGDQIVITDPVS